MVTLLTVRRIYYKRRHGLEPHHLDEWGTPIVPQVIPGNTRTVVLLRLVNSAILLFAIIFTSHSHWIIIKSPAEFDIVDSGEDVLPVEDAWKELEDAPHIVLIGKAFILFGECLAFSFSLVMTIHRLIVLDGANRNAEFGMFTIGGIVLLVSACLECWYATGFSFMDRDGIDYTMGGWIAAAICLFISSTIAFIDAFVSKQNLSILHTEVKQVVNPEFHRPRSKEEQQAMLDLEKREFEDMFP